MFLSIHSKHRVPKYPVLTCFSMILSTIAKTAIMVCFLALGAARWTEAHPTTAGPGSTKDCTWWHVRGSKRI